MEKVYRLLDWLTVENALDWLRTLTDTPISGGDLWRLTLSKQCDAYIQALGLPGHHLNDDGHEVAVIGRGFHLVVGSETLRKADKKNGIPEKRRLCLEGYWYEPFPDNIEVAIRDGYGYWEAVTESEEGYPLYFKCADIEGLATKMNGVSTRAAEVEFLRQELEQERAARHKAELRAEQAEAEAVDLRQQLGNAKTAYEALRRENRALHNGWDAAQVESTRKGKELAAVTAELERLRLGQDRAVQQGAEAEQDATVAKPSHLLAIAALVELLKSPVDRPRPQGLNQEAIKAAILEGFPWRGLSDRNLQTIFAAANRAKADAE